jgi:DNA-binding transcriptional ArsR family regulator
MVKYDGDLDRVFAALSDPTRRAMVDRLLAGPVTVTELAGPFPMTLAAVLQHLKVLQDSGLVSTEKHGRVRTCRAETGPLREAERWIAQRRTAWERRLDRLAELVDAPAEDLGGVTSPPTAAPAASPLETTIERTQP